MKLLKWLLTGSVLVSGAASLVHNKKEHIESHDKNSLSKRAFSVAQIYCFGTDKTMVQNAHLEVIAILQHGIERLQRLVTMLESNPVPAYIDMTPLDRTVWQTWEAFYGKAWSLTAYRQNQAALNRVKTVQSLAATMYRHLTGIFRPNIHVMCGESFLWQMNPRGESNPGFLWDTHVEVNDPDKGNWLGFNMGGWQSCSDAPHMTAYSYDPRFDNRDGGSVVVLCPNPMDGWRNKTANFDFVSNYHDMFPFGAKTMRLEDIWTYLPCTLVHEYTHSATLTKGRTNYLDADKTGPLADVCVGGQQVYQWHCIHRLANSSPDSAANNADTFALFFTALYFNMNDWSTGFCEELGLVVGRPRS